MCGLFGMILPHRYPTDLLHRGQALSYLGELAEERGPDAAGIAARFTHPLPEPDRWLLEKTSGPFRRLSRTGWLAGRLMTATTALGHTRWATQGSLTLTNASPACAGHLYCTHNGDLDIDTIPHRPHNLPTACTDSAVLFAALATAHRSRVNVRRLETILSQMQGRAALAWADTRDETGRVWLARAGLSPLAIARDVDGGLWWASNPAWLRKLSTAFALPLRSIDLLPEGTLLSASPLQASVRVQVRARFKPTIRARDQRLLPGAVWRNFTSNDRHNDLAVMRHRVIPRPAHPDDLAVRYPARAR